MRQPGQSLAGILSFSIIRVIEILQDILSGKGSMSNYNGLGVFPVRRDIMSVSLTKASSTSQYALEVAASPMKHFLAEQKAYSHVTNIIYKTIFPKNTINFRDTFMQGQELEVSQSRMRNLNVSKGFQNVSRRENKKARKLPREERKKDN